MIANYLAEFKNAQDVFLSYCSKAELNIYDNL